MIGPRRRLAPDGVGRFVPAHAGAWPDLEVLAARWWGGRLHPLVDATCPFGSVFDALSRFDASHGRGKVVLAMSEGGAA